MNFAELDKEIDKLSEELSKLNVRYEASKKDMNFSDEFIAEKRQAIESGNMPDEYKKIVEYTMGEAQKAGNARKAIVDSENIAPSRPSRQGIIRA